MSRRRHRTVYILYEARGGMSGFIQFAGRYVNLHHMAEAEGMDYNYLWRIFNRRREPSLPYARRIAGCLDMSELDFLVALRDRQRENAGIVDNNHTC